MNLSTNPTDVYNDVETAVVTVLSADSWLGNVANVATIHEKIREDLRSYYDHELPAIAVHAVGSEGDDFTTLRLFDQKIAVYIEVVDVGADFSLLDATVKKIASEVRRCMRFQIFAESGELDGLATDGRVTNGPAQFSYTEQEGRFVVVGQTWHTIELFTEE